MTSDRTAANGHDPHTGGVRVKRGLAEMLKGGVIMDVVTAEQAKIAEDAGAVAVMALERVPSDIRRDGGVARMSDAELIKEIMDAVTIPVMAKARIGHFVEAQVLEALGVDYIDESEVLTPADEEHHIDKWRSKCRSCAVPRPRRGAPPHRRRRGDDPHQGRGGHRQRRRGGAPHARGPGRDPRASRRCEDELMAEAKHLGAPFDLVAGVHETGKLPVVNFSAGGIATPADAALMMQLGCDGVFVGSGIFKSDDPEAYAKAIVAATTYLRQTRGHRRCQRRPGQGHARSRRRVDGARRAARCPWSVRPASFVRGRTLGCDDAKPAPPGTEPSRPLKRERRSCG